MRTQKRSATLALLSLPLMIGLQGCATSADAMPATQVDVFVLDLSTSNDASVQLKRIQEDIFSSLTEKSLGVPKVTPEGAPISGPVETIFTFVVDAAPRAETFVLQTAKDARKLWGEEFATDSERNAKSWTEISAAYSFYARAILQSNYTFEKTSCIYDLDKKLKTKFMGDGKRNRIVSVLCNKAETLSTNYHALLSYVRTEKAPATDIYGMLSKVDRLVAEVKKQDSNSVITVNLASDMQHETKDSRDTPSKLRALKLEPAASCSAGTSDRAKEGLTFDTKATLRVTGIGNARITAEYGNALIRYWQCYFPNAEIR